jgi:hypothetical protein
VKEKGTAGREVNPVSNLQSIVWPAATDAPDAIVRVLVVGGPLTVKVRVTVKHLRVGVVPVAFT